MTSPVCFTTNSCAVLVQKHHSRIIAEAVEIEIEFVTKALPGNLIGMNADLDGTIHPIRRRPSSWSLLAQAKSTTSSILSLGWK